MSRVVLLLVLTLSCGCIEPPPAPQVEPSPVTPKHLMSELVYKQYGLLVRSLESEPRDSAAWERSAAHAALLTEAGEILLRPGTVADESWRLAASALQDGGRATLDAIHAHDLDRARAAFEAMNESCASCHHECSAAYPIPWK